MRERSPISLNIYLHNSECKTQLSITSVIASGNKYKTIKFSRIKPSIQIPSYHDTLYLIKASYSFSQYIDWHTSFTLWLRKLKPEFFTVKRLSMFRRCPEKIKTHLLLKILLFFSFACIKLPQMFGCVLGFNERKRSDYI